MQNISEKRWLTPKDLFDEFLIGLQTQAKMRRDKRIPYSKVGKFIRYDREAINEWLEDHAVVKAG